MFIHDSLVCGRPMCLESKLIFETRLLLNHIKLPAILSQIAKFDSVKIIGGRTYRDFCGFITCFEGVKDLFESR